MNYELYMKEALVEAGKAMELKEVPIGAIIVYQDKIIGRGYNRRNSDKNTLSHAEIIAINEASEFMGDWRLEDCTIFITLEPCPMCAGAIIQARIPEVVIGAPNLKSGSGGTIINILEEERFNHQAKVIRSVLEDECGTLIKGFFEDLRQRLKKEKSGL